MTEAYSNPLQTIIDEFKTISPETTNVLIFKNNGQTIANTEAIIDLTEQDKIIEYAILSSQISESSSEMAKQFNLANIKSVFVEGKSVKVLCMSISENKISVFMEKTATHAWIIKRILL